jgi:hypothetical protein
VTSKNAVKLLVVAVALLVAVGAYIGLRGYNQDQAAQEASKSAAAVINVVDVAASDITAFSYAIDGKTVSFSLDDGQWVCDTDKKVDLDESAVTTMLGNLTGLTATQKVDGTEGFGFDNPTNVITYTASSGSGSLTIGMENPVTGEYYLKVGDGDVSYLVSSEFVTAFQKTLDDLKVVETATPTATDTAAAEETAAEETAAAEPTADETVIGETSIAETAATETGAPDVLVTPAATGSVG